jgi:carbon storage regulator CsrA
MLVLSRKNKESVVVGRGDGSESLVTVTVLDIRAGRVRLGFAGDPGVPIHRSEIWERMRASGELDSPTPGAPAPLDGDLLKLKG